MAYEGPERRAGEERRGGAQVADRRAAVPRLDISGRIHESPSEFRKNRISATQRGLAWATLLLFAGTVLMAGALAGTHSLSVQDTRELLDVVITAEVALASSTIAFYFGGRPGKV